MISELKLLGNPFQDFRIFKKLAQEFLVQTCSCVFKHQEFDYCIRFAFHFRFKTDNSILHPVMAEW